MFIQSGRIRCSLPKLKTRAGLNACQVENCFEKNGHWVVINDKNVDLLDEESSTGLKINNLELSDADGYKCEAEYTAATAGYTMTLLCKFTKKCHRCC